MGDDLADEEYNARYRRYFGISSAVCGETEASRPSARWASERGKILARLRGRDGSVSPPVILSAATSSQEAHCGSSLLGALHTPLMRASVRSAAFDGVARRVTPERPLPFLAHHFAT